MPKLLFEGAPFSSDQEQVGEKKINIEPAIQETFTFFENHPEQVSRLPGRLKQSLLRAFALLGIALAPEMAHAQSPEADLPEPPKIEVGNEATLQKQGGLSWASTIEADGKFKGISFEIGGKAIFGRTILVPGNAVPDSSGIMPKLTEKSEVTGVEADTAADIVEKGRLNVRVESELSREGSETSWFVGAQAGIDLSHGATLYVDSGKYIDFTGGEHEPGYRVKAGFQQELKSHLGFLPEGTAYVEFGGAGREKGWTIGFTHPLAKKGGSASLEK